MMTYLIVGIVSFVIGVAVGVLLVALGLVQAGYTLREGSLVRLNEDNKE